MTKRIYEDFADALLETLEDGGDPLTVGKVAARMAHIFKADNPRFNADKFFDRALGED